MTGSKVVETVMLLVARSEKQKNVLLLLDELGPFPPGNGRLCCPAAVLWAGVIDWWCCGLCFLGQGQALSNCIRIGLSGTAPGQQHHHSWRAHIFPYRALPSAIKISSKPFKSQFSVLLTGNPTRKIPAHSSIGQL